MKIKLVITSEAGKKTIVEFNQSYCTIGRKESHITLLDPRCSSQHALLYEDYHGVLKVKDLASSNGTFVGNQRVQDAAVKIGDKLLVGRSELEVLEFVSSNQSQTVPLIKDENKDSPDEHSKNTATIIEKNAVQQWPDNLLAFPPKVRDQFVDYIDEKGRQNKLPLKELLIKKQTKK